MIISRTFGVLVLLATLVGCNAVDRRVGVSGAAQAQLNSLMIVALEDANDKQATELDLVFTYREDIAATLPRDASGWFLQRDALMNRYAGDIDVVRLQIPPGFVIDEVKLPNRRSKAFQVLAYANYVSATGQPVLPLTTWKRVRLTLRKERVAVKPIR